MMSTIYCKCQYLSYMKWGGVGGGGYLLYSTPVPEDSADFKAREFQPLATFAAALKSPPVLF
jgi:hypothetical protein